MKYYEMHDDVYKSLRKKGAVTWDGQEDVNSIFEHPVNQAINEKLNKFFPNTTGMNALDLGTGTGNAALFLASKGFSSCGFDISNEAIEMAKENAKRLGVEANFQVQDICKYTGTGKYDLIIDSSFLHCIVGTNERDNIFANIRHVLTDNGYFFVHTMIQSDDMSVMLNKEHLFFEDNILWSTGSDSWDMDWQNINGKRVFPHRKILNLEALEQEFCANQFVVMNKRVIQSENSPSTYIAWLKVAG